MKVVTATLTYQLEYEDDDEIGSDPSELLLEMLAGEKDAYLLDCITVTRTVTN
jgi:hypothetical protein